MTTALLIWFFLGIILGFFTLIMGIRFAIWLSKFDHDMADRYWENKDDDDDSAYQ